MDLSCTGIYLDYFDNKEKRERQRDQDEKKWAQSYEVGKHSRSLLTLALVLGKSWNISKRKEIFFKTILIDWVRMTSWQNRRSCKHYRPHHRNMYVQFCLKTVQGLSACSIFLTGVPLLVWDGPALSFSMIWWCPVPPSGEDWTTAESAGWEHLPPHTTTLQHTQHGRDHTTPHSTLQQLKWDRQHRKPLSLSLQSSWKSLSCLCFI